MRRRLALIIGGAALLGLLSALATVAVLPAHPAVTADLGSSPLLTPVGTAAGGAASAASGATGSGSVVPASGAGGSETGGAQAGAGSVAGGAGTSTPAAGQGVQPGSGPSSSTLGLPLGSVVSRLPISTASLPALPVLSLPSGVSTSIPLPTVTAITTTTSTSTSAPTATPTPTATPAPTPKPTAAPTPAPTPAPVCVLGLICL
jgi:hypothetical protein